MVDSNDNARLGIEFTAEVYRTAAIEGASSLARLYRAGDYRLAMYVSGLAVESLLRAYRTRFDPEFDSRHDLLQLSKDCRISEHIPRSGWEKYSADLIAVTVRWSNNHRFRSETALRNYLKRFRLDRGIKGDILKENARRIVAAAVRLVALGDRLWKT